MLEHVQSHEPPSPVPPEEPQLSPTEKTRFQLQLAERMSDAHTDEALMAWADQYAARFHDLTTGDAALRQRIREDRDGALGEVATRLSRV